MTFICNYSIGGIVNIFTCDTRQVMSLFGKEIKINDSPTKIHQITDRLICMGGGVNSIADYIIKKLKKNCSSEIIELEIKGILKTIDVDVQKKFHRDFKNDKHAQIMIAGFTAIGKTFIVNYIPGEENEEERIFLGNLPYGNPYIGGATPEGFDNVLDVIMTESQQIHNGMTHVEITQFLIGTIAAVQREMFNAAPEKVSEWMCYTAMLWDKDRFTPVTVSNKMCLLPVPVEEVTE